jgi:hypothetical protein
MSESDSTKRAAPVDPRRLGAWLVLWSLLAVGLWANWQAAEPGYREAGLARRLVAEVGGETPPLRRASLAADETFRNLRGGIRPPVVFLQFEGFDPESPLHCEHAGLYYNKAMYWLTDTAVYIGESAVINTGEDVLRAQAGFELTPAFIAAHEIDMLVVVAARDGQVVVESRYVGGGM